VPGLPRPTGSLRLTPHALAITMHLLTHGPASRGHLGRDLSLSDASMSRATQTLVRDGLVSETTDPRSGVGRPRQILTPVPTARHVVGVKLTQDRAYGVACDLVGAVLASAETRLPARGARGVVPVGGTLRVVARLVERLARRLPSLDGVGVSVGGVVDDRSVVREGSFLGWRDVDVAGPLREAVEAAVVVTNDVTALAREQLWFGAGRTHSTFGLVTFGAGLGFGLAREGHVVERLIDNGHLLGHAPVDADGPRCSLGHRGCVAAYLYRDEVEARMAAAGVSGSFAEVIREPAYADSPWVTDAARALGHLVATFAGALQTERIVLAGEDVEPLFASPVVAATIADRTRPGPQETQHCELDVSTAPLTFVDWARGAAVVSLQHSLGAL
jgi:predicted NBD/HSP70 family sugar kinase